MKRVNLILKSGAGEPFNLTAMIDVVFLLLIFFIVTFKPIPVEALLKTDAGGTETGWGEMVRITILPEAYRLNNQTVSLARIDQVLSRSGELWPEMGVVVSCDGESRHERLIAVLDLCEKAGLKNVSLQSRRDQPAVRR